MVQQLIHGTQYIDELVMVRVSNKGDLYVHQDANSNVMLDRLRRETDAMTVRSLHDKTATRQGQFGLILDSPSPGSRDCCGATCGPGPQRRVKDRLVERYTYTPYGELTVDQETSFGDYDGDADVDSTDQAAYGGGGDCAVPMFSGVTGACRILDLDFDGRILNNDAGLHNALEWGFARHPGRTATSVSQPFAHQGLLHEPEIASYQNRARQYDPVKRRFLQRDGLGTLVELFPLGLEPTANLYAYVSGNPLRRRDPSGFADCEKCPSPDCFPVSGTNWCGPGYSGGLCDGCEGPPAPPTGPSLVMDTCCMHHDNCYADNDCSYPCDSCDATLCSCLNGVTFCGPVCWVMKQVFCGS